MLLQALYQFSSVKRCNIILVLTCNGAEIILRGLLISRCFIIFDSKQIKLKLYFVVAKNMRYIL